VVINREKQKGHLLPRLVSCDSTTKNINIKMKRFSQSWNTPTNVIYPQITNNPPPPQARAHTKKILKNKRKISNVGFFSLMMTISNL
jgi:hypothetical protein